MRVSIFCNCHLTSNPLLIILSNNSKTYADSSTSTLWRHLKKYHSEILGNNDGQEEKADNQEVQKREKVFIVFKFLYI